jgi:hypothetical protein
MWFRVTEAILLPTGDRLHHSASLNVHRVGQFELDGKFKMTEGVGEPKGRGRNCNKQGSNRRTAGGTTFATLGSAC